MIFFDRTSDIAVGKSKISGRGLKASVGKSADLSVLNMTAEASVSFDRMETRGYFESDYESLDKKVVVHSFEKKLEGSLQAASKKLEKEISRKSKITEISNDRYLKESKEWQYTKEYHVQYYGSDKKCE